jgi:hypothetical protein
MIVLNKTIRLFLDSIGRREEYEFYLEKFQSARSACFALLCPDMESIETAAEMLAFDLHFLLRLELLPAILLCGAEADRMRAALAVEPIFAFHSVEEGPAAAFIERAREEEKVPVLVAAGRELEDALLEWIPSVAKRVHFIRAAGGLRNSAGELVPYLYLRRDSGPGLETLDFDYPALGRRLLEARPGAHLSITSPLNLLQEIFTVKGAGTLFRRGSEIRRFQNINELDRGRLVQLFETSFGRTLADHAFIEQAEETYLETEYRGAVMLEAHPAGMYLSKFAVGREARGEGLALELWREVSRDHAALFWRSHAANPFNSWYHNRADGHHASGQWQVFWCGVSADSVSDIIAYCCGRKEDFIT